MPDHIVSIDPGISGTGLAVWSWLDWNQKVSPIACRNFYPGKAEEHSWQENSQNLISQISSYLLETSGMTVRVFCEWPAYMMGGVSHTVTAKGDLHKLCYFIGGLGRELWNEGIPFQAVDVNTWKGSLKKPLVIKRIKEAIPDVYRLKPTSHSWDAIGIGLYQKGYLHVEQQRRSRRIVKRIR